MISALCRYYDYLEKHNKIIEDGFSECKINYQIIIDNEGNLKDILPYTIMETINKKQVEVPRIEIFPFRYSKPGIFAETIEHRGKYIFGIDYKDDNFIINDNSIKAFESLKKQDLEFIEGINTKIVNAYRNFLLKWNPEQNINNQIIESLGKKYKDAKFIICLNEDILKSLNNDAEIKEKWRLVYNNKPINEELKGQCSITGQIEEIQTIHNSLSGIVGGNSTGVNLVCFNEKAFESYGKTQSLNSSIGSTAMKKYTTAFNYLTSHRNHKRIVGNMTLIYWVENVENEDDYIDFINFSFDGFNIENKIESDDKIEKEDDIINQKDKELSSIVTYLSQGKYPDMSKFNIDNNVKFYLLGVEPNSARLAVKIFEKNNFGDFVNNVLQHIKDTSLLNKEDEKILSMFQIENSLKSKSTSEKVSSIIMSSILDSILKNKKYPMIMMSTLVKRMKIETDGVNSTRVRLVKGYLIRKKVVKGDFLMDREIENNVAYTLGEMFALLENIQKQALGKDLNATIKDKFFASACGTPSLVFPRLINLAQSHLKKINKEISINFENKLGYFMSKLENGFPKTLSLDDQGLFQIGYYSQKYLINKKNNDTDKGTEE